MSIIQTEKFGVKEVANVTFYDLVTNKPVIFFDSLKMSNQEHTAETTYARGGQGNARLIGWDFNRDTVINMQDALMSQKMMALMAGTEVKTTANISVFEELTVDDEMKVTLAKLPAGATPVVSTIYTDDVDMVSTAGSDAVSYSITSGVVTITNGASAPVSVVEGDLVTIAYTYETTTAQSVMFKTDSYPGTYKMVGDALVRDTDGVDHPYQVVAYKAKLTPGTTVAMTSDGDPSVFDFTMDLLKGDNNNMIEYIKY